MTDASLSPASGRLTGNQHSLPLRVYYEDTDAAGIVYHAVYLHYAERARTEALRLCGLDHGRLAKEQGLHFAARLAEKYVIMAKGAVMAQGKSDELSADMVRQHLTV